MHILLKDLLKEVADEEGNENPLKIQFYCDMDGVLADMEKGFKELSGGLSPKEYEEKNGKNSFWKLIAKKPNFWLELEPMPDAKILWTFIKQNFKDPAPVILTAGQGQGLIQQKTQWAHKHIDPSVKVIVSSAGTKKPDYILPLAGRVTHVLLDDTQKNIDVWDNVEKHRVAILHKDAGSSIEQLKSFINK
jgi:hypothetical protein